jgi:hypoxanthine-DNA glycosylase
MIKAFAPIATPKSRILILGTMPGEKSLQLQEYYGNRGNRFWSIMFSIFGRELSHDYTEKVKLLTHNGIALWDVLASCQRPGSLDSNIKNEVANDFDAFYKQHPGITHVFFSSKNAAAYYDKHVGRREGLVYATLPSPSGANASMAPAQKRAIWQQMIAPLLQ